MFSLARIAFAVAVAVGLAAGGVSDAVAGALKVTARKIVEKKPTHEIEFAYPQTGNAAIDRRIETWVKQEARDLAATATVDRQPRENPYSSEISYEVGRNDSDMFGVLFTNYTYTGGAHPNSNFTAFNFLLPDGASVEIGDLFTNAGIGRISQIAIASLKHDLSSPGGPGDTDWIAKGAAANGYNFENFILKRNELALYFDAYHVAAYAVGPQEVHIPLQQLRAFMRPDPRAPAASFDCAKAGTEVEKAICASRDLARLDRHVADKYFDSLAWAVDEPARAKLRNGQRLWLATRDTGCLTAAQAMSACLTTSYQARLKALEAPAE